MSFLPRDSSLWHELTGAAVAARWQVNPAVGLSAAEVERRRAEQGANRMTARAGTPAWVKFLQQFNP